MQKANLLIDLHYLPSLEYFVLLQQFETVTIDCHENYQKQSFRNRCYINTTNGNQKLIIPVVDGNKKVNIKEVKIDYNQKWLNVHWRGIESGYGKSPYFLYYEAFFNEALHKKPIYLFDLNIELLTYCLKLLKIKTKIIFTDKYIDTHSNDYIDYRNLIDPKKDFKLNHIYLPYMYQQIFGKVFESNLSIIDLLFCEGNRSLEILLKSSVRLQEQIE